MSDRLKFAKKNNGEKKALTTEARVYRNFIYGGLGLLCIMIVVLMIVLFTTIKTKEDKEVPSLVGLTLEDAMLTLQKLKLHGHISVKFTDDNADKGRVIAQGDRKGSSVKSGAVVSMTVSRGKASNTLIDLIGEDVDNAKDRLVSAGYADMVTIRRPYNYKASDEPRGTILSQSPEKGLKFNENIELSFIVSEGDISNYIEVPDFSGRTYLDLIDLIKSGNSAFNFKFSFGNKKKKEKIVYAQSPAKGAKALPGEVIDITIGKPSKLADDVSYGVIDAVIDEYKAKVPVSVIVEPEEGDSYEYFSLMSKGGLISIPYIEKVGSIFIIKVDGKVVEKQMVKVNK
jgi:beta-lactam-binding protein with PASTA domain